jgi:hypothetical protein
VGEREKKNLITLFDVDMTTLPETHSRLLTNFGSIRDPFTGCRTFSFMGFIGSQPKHVLKISASNNVVPSFCRKRARAFHDRQQSTDTRERQQKEEKNERGKKSIKLNCATSFLYVSFLRWLMLLFFRPPSAACFSCSNWGFLLHFICFLFLVLSARRY